MKVKKRKGVLRRIAECGAFLLCWGALTVGANCFVPLVWLDKPEALAVLVPLLLLLNIVPNIPAERFLTRKLRALRRGTACLWLFTFSLVPSVTVQTVLAFRLLPHEWGRWLLSVLVCTLILAVVFWNGMISVYLCSVQLGIYRRAVGLLLGLVPILNFIQLVKILRTVSDEVRFETETLRRDALRKDDAVCATKYPLLMVHGVFFRDSAFFNYWGRIPDALTANGAHVYYGEHESAASVANAARELAARIRELVEETGCEKVNIIAHSKGGLDCRYAIAKLGIAPYVASLTTVNTPHRGCEFADELLQNIPISLQKKVAIGYNAAMKAMGDENPDFMAAVNDLTASACERLNREIGTDISSDVFVRSIGSRLNRASGGRFPLNMTYSLVKRFDGPNDGLVSESSFRFGNDYRLLTVNGKRGVSHGDMIDLNRENIPEFDVREFYVSLVNELKMRGL